MHLFRNVLSVMLASAGYTMFLCSTCNEDLTEVCEYQFIVRANMCEELSVFVQGDIGEMGTRLAQEVDKFVVTQIGLHRLARIR